MRILAGDIGGTKVDLGLFETREEAAAPVLLEDGRFASGDFEDLERICREFLKASRPSLAGSAQTRSTKKSPRSSQSSLPSGENLRRHDPISLMAT